MRTIPPESRTSCATAAKRSDSFNRRRAPLMKVDSPSMEQAKLDKIGNKSGICSKFTWIGLCALPVIVIVDPFHVQMTPALSKMERIRLSACTESGRKPVTEIDCPVIAAATSQMAPLDQSPSIRYFSLPWKCWFSSIIKLGYLSSVVPSITCTPKSFIVSMVNVT